MKPEVQSKPNVDSSVINLTDNRMRLSEADFANVNALVPGKICESLIRRMLQLEEAVSVAAAEAGPACINQSLYIIVELALSPKEPPYKFATAEEVEAAHGAIDQLIERNPGLRRLTNARIDMPFVLRVEPRALGAVSELAQLAEVARLS